MVMKKSMKGIFLFLLMAITLAAFTLRAPTRIDDECGYKADGKYHCGTNCSYKADGKFHCGTNCGYKSDGKFHCEGDDEKNGSGGPISLSR